MDAARVGDRDAGSPAVALWRAARTQAADRNSGFAGRTVNGSLAPRDLALTRNPEAHEDVDLGNLVAVAAARVHADRRERCCASNHHDHKILLNDARR